MAKKNNYKNKGYPYKFIYFQAYAPYGLSTLNGYFLFLSQLLQTLKKLIDVFPNLALSFIPHVVDVLINIYWFMCLFFCPKFRLRIHLFQLNQW